MSRLEAFKRLTPIAYKVAYRYRRKLPSYISTDDLVNVALMGVWEAVTRRYENGLGPMIALASLRAQGAVIDYLRTLDWSSRRMRSNGTPATMLYLGEHDLDLNYAESAAYLRTPEDEAAENQIESRKSAALEEALAKLSDRTRYIIRRLLAGEPHVVVAAELNVSAPRISQILTETLPKLKNDVQRALSRTNV